MSEQNQIDYNAVTPATLEHARKAHRGKIIETIIPLILKDIYDANLRGCRRFDLLEGSKYGDISLSSSDLFDHVKPLMEARTFKTSYIADNYIQNVKTPVLTIYW